MLFRGDGGGAVVLYGLAAPPAQAQNAAAHATLGMH